MKFSFNSYMFEQNKKNENNNNNNNFDSKAFDAKLSLMIKKNNSEN